MIFTKMTFFLMYLQLFRPLKWLRICVYTGATVSTIFYVTVGVFWTTSITPRKGQTFASVAVSAAEFKSLLLSVPSAAAGLGIDLYLLVLAITAVMQLQLSTRRKIGVILIFLTGLAYDPIAYFYRYITNDDLQCLYSIRTQRLL